MVRADVRRCDQAAGRQQPVEFLVGETVYYARHFTDTVCSDKKLFSSKLVPEICT